MCCQGKRRELLSQSIPSWSVHESAPAVVSTPMAPPTVVYFEYTGQTGLTAVGPITGKRYRFARPGMTIAVDGRDAPSLAAVPKLRRVPG